jgi:hypothetical protein
MAHDIGWEPAYRQDAMAMKATIESVMDVLWPQPAGLNKQDLSLHEFKCYFCVGGNIAYESAGSKNIFHLTVRREKHSGGWTDWSADLGEIEAFLSLWLYQIQLDKTQSVKETKDEEEEGEENVVDLFIWAVAPLSATSCLDFDHWIRRSSHSFRAQDSIPASTIFKLDGLRGMRSPQCENFSQRPGL